MTTAICALACGVVELLRKSSRAARSPPARAHAQNRLRSRWAGAGLRPPERARGAGKNAKSAASKWRKHSRTCAAKAFHPLSLYVGGAREGSLRSCRLYTGIEMSQNPLPAPPIARKIHTETLMHGVLLTDDYAWLRDKENPEVTAYLEAENAYAEAVMAPLAGLRDELYQEMLSHMKQTDVSVPYRDGDWWYYTRTEEGLQYAHPLPQARRARGTGCRCDRRSGARRQSSWPRGTPSFAIGDTDITDDGRWLAYTTDTTGFRQYTLRIKDLETGETLAGRSRARGLRRLGRGQSDALLHR